MEFCEAVAKLNQIETLENELMCEFSDEEKEFIFNHGVGAFLQAIGKTEKDLENFKAAVQLLTCYFLDDKVDPIWNDVEPAKEFLTKTLKEITCTEHQTEEYPNKVDKEAKDIEKLIYAFLDALDTEEVKECPKEYCPQKESPKEGRSVEDVLKELELNKPVEISDSELLSAVILELLKMHNVEFELHDNILKAKF